MEPAEQLRDELQFWRDGDQFHPGGLPFHEAWERALARVCRGRGARFWRATFEEQRPVWRRAYLRADPTPADEMLATFVHELGVATARDRRCGFCREPIPDKRRPQAQFCNRDHRRKAKWQRERAAQKPRNDGPTAPSADRRAALQGEGFDMFATT